MATLVQFGMGTEKLFLNGLRRARRRRVRCTIATWMRAVEAGIVAS
jgi:hypothetical protein